LLTSPAISKELTMTIGRAGNVWLMILMLGGTLLGQATTAIRAGASAVPITPFGKNPDWDGPVTASGVWGEIFTDSNQNGRWDPGEPFVDDRRNSELDPTSRGRYDGIFLAGFGNDRIATGKHDGLWVRALVLDSGTTRIAIVAVDLIGYYENAGYYGIAHAQKLLDQKLGIQEIILSSTHNHEGPDTIGLWGNNQVSGGTFPLYLKFVDRQIARAITLAAQAAVPVRMKLGATNPQSSPALAGMQTRTDGRPPRFFDEELRVMQFVGTDGPDKGKAVATLVNWNTHPESMEDENTTLTSDFPGAVRDAIEKRYGGTAIYVSGDLGAVEIVGDNNRSSRTKFDGKDFPVVTNNKAATFTFARTEAIGREVAKAAVNAIEKAEWSAVSEISIQKRELRVPMDNLGYQFLINKGVLARIHGFDAAGGPQVVSTVYAVRLGDAQIVTVPGELFPEVYYGVAKHRREDCSKAATGRPPEPPVREFMTAKYKFVFGLSPDELGYFVPGYDFLAPRFDPEAGLQESKDACAGVPDHYHETNSASSILAPAWACTAVELLGATAAKFPACASHTTQVTH
jgi:hypothetical protein